MSGKWRHIHVPQHALTRAVYFMISINLTAWSQQSPAVEFWWLTGIVCVAFAICTYKSFMFLLRKRMIEDIATSKVRSAAQGYVELEGRAELLPGQPIIAPLSGVHCVWYSYSIKERRGSGRDRHWATVQSGVSDSLFLLVDHSGECIVDPDGARITPGTNDTWYGSSIDSRPKITGTRWSIFGGHYHFTELRLNAGATLYAIGLFETIGGAGHSGNPQTMLKSLLREWKADTEMLLGRFDVNSDGEISLQEWEAVRQQAWAEVVKQHAELETQKPVYTLTDTHDQRRPYLLSALPQFDLVRRMHWYMIGLFGLALATGALASFLINARLG